MFIEGCKDIERAGRTLQFLNIQSYFIYCVLFYLYQNGVRSIGLTELWRETQKLPSEYNNLKFPGPSSMTRYLTQFQTVGILVQRKEKGRKIIELKKKIDFKVSNL